MIGAAAWEGETGNDSSHALNESYTSQSPNEHLCTCGELADFNGDILRAAVTRTPEQIEEFRRRKREGLCYRCGGKNHVGKDCTNPEDLNPPKNSGGDKRGDNDDKDRLRAAVFTLENTVNNEGEWNVEIIKQRLEENESGKVEGAPLKI